MRICLLLLFSSLCLQAQSITSHFESWLDGNGYASYDFERTDLPFGSYGGKVDASDTVLNQPVIFIHGNSDSAGGWSNVLTYFESQGYTSAELYATTWGPADPDFATDQYHSKAYLTRLRAFVEAVIAYTGAAEVDIIGHSMGVTLGRKVVKGGWANDLANGGWYHLGSPLTSSVDTFVGIAGANQGLVACYLTGPTTPTCGSTNGFYPGYLWYGLGPYGVSNILVDINSSVGYEGSHVFSIWSTEDNLIGYSNLVYGKRTSRIPGQDGEQVFTTSTYDHFTSRSLSAYEQWSMVTAHTW